MLFLQNKNNKIAVTDQKLVLFAGIIALFLLIDTILRFKIGFSIFTPFYFGDFYPVGYVEIGLIILIAALMPKLINKVPLISVDTKQKKLILRDNTVIDLNKARGLDFGEQIKLKLIKNQNNYQPVEVKIDVVFNDGNRKTVITRKDAESDVSTWSIFISEVNNYLGAENTGFEPIHKKEYKRKSESHYRIFLACMIPLLIFIIIFFFILTGAFDNFGQ